MEIRFIETPEDMALAYAVRDVVFVDEQQVTHEEERDEHDAVAIHVLALDDGQALGTARLLLKADGVGKIGRVAVLKAARGKHVGIALMEALHERAAALGLCELVLDAQVQVISFYERLGYVAEGDLFEDARIMHRFMRRRVQ